MVMICPAVAFPQQSIIVKADKEYNVKSPAKNISEGLSLNDTLQLIMNYQGCYGGIGYRFGLVRRAGDYEVLVYNSRRSNERGTWQIDFAKPLPDSLYEYVTAFEKELRNYQSSDHSWCTVSGYFSFIAPEGSFSLEINDCAILIGEELKKLLSERSAMSLR
ncbi:MAG: hypothetical protein JWO44_1023 [Bacteroidetes bacterium]|nr:hypothetical protein [Bacteroidota bacterium]